MNEATSPSVPRPDLPARALVLRGALVFVGYVLGGWAGLQLATVAGAVTLVWPPTGISIAALVVGGRGMAGPIWAGALVVNLLVGGNLLSAAMIATGNLLEAYVAASLLGRLGFYGSFDSRRQVRDFAWVAGVVAPVCAALVGLFVLWGLGRVDRSNATAAALLWWAGDATGALVVGPLVLTWLRPSKALGVRPWAMALVLVGASAALAFAVPQFGSQLRSALLLAPVAALVWSALSLGPRGAATACALICLVAALGSASAGGPLGGEEGPPVSLWLFMTSAAVLSLLVTALNAERGTAERATQLSRARFADAFEHAPVGMAMLSPEGVVVAANPQLAEMLSAERDDVQGEALERWWPPGALEEARGVSASEPNPLLVTVTDESGEAREWIVRVRHVPLGGEREELLLQAEDVTESRLNASALKVLTEQLVHAQRMDSVGNLAGGIAHDFNNLLQAIGANLEMAKRVEESARRARLLDNAGDAVKRAAALTSRLLAFSHRSPVQRVPVDLNETLQRAKEMLIRLLPENVSLHVMPASEPALALADETQLDQVLLNLCVNARDAMPDGGRIELRVEVQPQWIVITATDEGEGVPEELRPRIFEPFFTTKARGQGTGFGLAVVFGIMRAHEGDIRLDDALDAPSAADAVDEAGELEPQRRRGARFILRLPRTQERPTPSEVRASADASRRLTILLAEDEASVRHVLADMLRGEGHRVVEAANGEEAVARAEEQGEGLDLATHPGLPAILMSGYSGEDMDEADARLAAELLPKPFERADLLLAIQRATG